MLPPNLKKIVHNEELSRENERIETLQQQRRSSSAYHSYLQA